MEHPVHTCMYIRSMFMLSDRYEPRGRGIDLEKKRNALMTGVTLWQVSVCITPIAITRVMSSVSDGNGIDGKSLTANMGAGQMGRNRKVWLNIWPFRAYVMLVLITTEISSSQYQFLLQIAPLIGDDNRIINCDEILRFSSQTHIKEKLAVEIFLSF